MSEKPRALRPNQTVSDIFIALPMDAQRGSWKGLRFCYEKNMAGCTRTVLEQDVYTALYGYGAGLPYTDAEGNYVPGYRRKLTFGGIHHCGREHRDRGY